MSRLPPLPKTHIDDSGMIYGEDFNDTYFSRDNGLDESRLVFLQGCGLPDAWAGRDCFVIGELGFGTGLNVLATWDLWNRTRKPGSILHIITVEGFLLDGDVAQEAHKKWPELKHLSDQLIAKWPTRSYGAQRIWFAKDGVCITFLIGPCADVLARMDFTADCWFLDGFSPARNPQMWSADVFIQIARLSAPGTRIGTYSVAGVVKSGLRDVGFKVQRFAGYGSKRQRLEAYIEGTPPAGIKRPKSAIVVGGGIAGASVGAALARRGVAVDLFDDDLCGRTKASGNPIALIMPRLDRADTREARFFRAAYLMALQTYGQMGEAFEQTGVREVRQGDEAILRLVSLGENPPLPESHMSKAQDNSLLHVQGGVAYPDLVVKNLQRGAILHPVGVAQIIRVSEGWCAIDAQGNHLATADICIIAGGPGSALLTQHGAHMRGRAGQLSWTAVHGALPDTPLSGAGYGAVFHNKLVFGATFDDWELQDPPPPVSAEGHRRNADMLAQVDPDLAARLNLAPSGRTSIRATTSDQVPIVGALHDEGPGKFVLCGLGSRGFTTSFLCAELIASLACGEPCPVENQVALALAPDRFAKRAQRRGPQ